LKPVEPTISSPPVTMTAAATLSQRQPRSGRQARLLGAVDSSEEAGELMRMKRTVSRN
jgi:hypothetical protein